MKKIEQLFDKKGFSDPKCKLNRFNKAVPAEYLDKIESGVTLEDLDKMAATGLPIFKYTGQITIHGLFDDLTNNRIFGYKNVFQNQNRSIGVKYNAIDEAKRQRIANRVEPLGFRYTRTSTSVGYERTVAVTKENYEEEKAKALAFINAMDERLFIGNKQIWVGDMWGNKYLVTEFSINAIYESNIEPFLSSIGATKEVFDAHNEKIVQETAARLARWAEEKEKDLLAKDQAQLEHADEINTLRSMVKVEKTQECGRYIRMTFDHKNRIVFESMHLYKPKGKQKNRLNRQQFYNLNDAIQCEAEERYSDQVYNGTITGYIVK